MEDFLQALAPNITIIAALFSASVTLMPVAWTFINYEDKIRAENLNRVKELNDTFRQKYIEARVERTISEEMNRGYEYGASTIRNLLYQETDLIGTKTLKPLDDISQELKQYNSIIKIGKQNLDKDLEKFSYSDAGQNLYASLDTLYEKKLNQNKYYTRSKFFCRATWISCLIAAFLCIIGIIVRGVSINSSLVINFWLFTLIEVITIGVISVFLMFRYKTILTERWEQMKIFGGEISN